MKKDWIDTLNTEFLQLDDRNVVEYMIIYLNDKKLGDAFVSWLRAKRIEEAK